MANAQRLPLLSDDEIQTEAGREAGFGALPVELPHGWEPTPLFYAVRMKAGTTAMLLGRTDALLDPSADYDASTSRPLLRRSQTASNSRREGVFEPGSPPEPQIDLTEYRRRAAQWLEEMSRVPSDDVPAYKAFLTELLPKLKGLMLDLASVSASSQWLLFRRFMDQLQDIAGSTPIADERIKELWCRTQETLGQFVDPAAPAAFWKKRIVT